MARHIAVNVRRGRNIRTMAMVMASLLVGVTVIVSTRAAFSNSTGNNDNSFSAGSVTITDDDGGSALFEVTAMAPGATHENCIVVTYSGTLPAEVRLYGTAGSSSDLNAALTLTVERGTGGSFAGTEPSNGAASCTGFSGSEVFTGTLTAFLAATDYASGVDSWSVGSGDDATYRFYVEFDTVDNGLQGSSSEVSFTWEAQNT